MKKLCSKALKTLINKLNRPVGMRETSQKKAICNRVRLVTFKKVKHVMPYTIKLHC